jgi:hypothetical protein
LLVFLAVGLIACIVFYGSSVVYNRLVLHKRGTEAFPSLSGVIASVRVRRRLSLRCCCSLDSVIV